MQGPQPPSQHSVQNYSKNGFELFKGQPREIAETSTTKTGKHGHPGGVDTVPGKKYEAICPSTHDTDILNLKRNDFQLIGIQDGNLSWLQDSGEMWEGLPLPEGDLSEEAAERRSWLQGVCHDRGGSCCNQGHVEITGCLGGGGGSNCSSDP